MNRRHFVKAGGIAGVALSWQRGQRLLRAPASIGVLGSSLGTLLDTPAEAASPATQTTGAGAITRAETLRWIAEGAPNSLDPHGDGINRESFGAFTNVYDCLLQFARTPFEPGVYRYDYRHLRGALCTAFEPLDNGTRWRFHLRPDTRFHSGNVVDAAAVKWSLDRAVSLPASMRQLATGSMTHPEQFVIEDALTLRIDLPRADRYALPNLALTYTSILDATVLQTHATAADPWATAWLRDNAAGGGAYTVAQWQSGQRIDYLRYDRWRNGTLPSLRRGIAQAVPDASNRLAALIRGDADIAMQLPPREFDTVARHADLRAVSIPLTNTFRFLAFNTKMKPFDDQRVRQAIAYAMPFDALFAAVARGRGKPLFPTGPVKAGNTAAQPLAEWPQPYPYRTDPDHARALLKLAGYADGFATTLTYNAADAAVAEPAALLIQEALAAVNIRIDIRKVPGAQWGELQTAKKTPFYIDWSSAWFNDPDYFYRIFFEGNWRWNFGSFDDPALAALTDAARWDSDTHHYDAAMRQAADIVMQQLPILPLWLPSLDIAMRRDLAGYTYYIHGQVDLRPMRRAVA